MRVIAGSRRSLPLKSLEGDNTRPTVDKYKETLFNCIQMEVPDSMFLDLFSGSGAIGIEALSRGAKRAVLVENNKQALDVIKANIHFTKFENEAEIVKSDVISYVSRLPKITFDVIFMDPPYGKGLEKEVIEILNTKEFTNPDYTIIIEATLDEDMSYIEDTKFKIYKTKNYKNNKHVFLCAK
ncbi:MAG: 16S rRNA (guanine(966)-N(2))-methyltransferase RsmD [Eubacterium sp.]|nr:16S rRNA (guanine(966)-N(2))-methyltransferase RsmD [Eubacterium sp.]MBR1773845.1 16S rRNA (guanine(966)-N(2))-methyltransferase RsmD [Eubacterium sp.]